MCGRYSLTRSKDDLKLALNIDGELVDFPPRYNAAPQQELPVVFQNGEKRDLVMKTWGLLPSWAKDPSKYQINLVAKQPMKSPSSDPPSRATGCSGGRRRPGRACLRPRAELEHF